MIVGDDKAIDEIAMYLQLRVSQEWYADGKKEFDADVKILSIDEQTEFHLG